MYGTVAKFKVKPGQEQKLKEVMVKQASAGMEMKGFIGELVYKLDRNPNEYLIAVVFEDRDSYQANANDPAQHRRYLEYRELLETDPEWNDGEIVDHHGLR